MFDEKYTQPYTVQSHFIDDACRFTLCGMLAKSQDLVSFHFGDNQLSIPHMLKRGQTWVISKQHFEITAYPLWRDELALQSWLEPLKGPFIYYDFSFSYVEPHGKKKDSNQPILQQPVTADTKLTPFLKASSQWLILNLSTMRPTKPEGKEFTNFKTCDEKAIAGKFPKIDLPDTWLVTEAFSPRSLDIDLNGHVNNLQYVQYIMTWLPTDVNGMLVKTLDTNFVSSAHKNDTLLCQSAVVANAADAAEHEKTLVHRIVRADGSEVFRARTVWAPEATLSRPIII